METVQKPCPGCGSTVLWPMNVTEIQCWKCDRNLRLAQPLKPASRSGQHLMVGGLVVMALAFVIAVVSAL